MAVRKGPHVVSPAPALSGAVLTSPGQKRKDEGEHHTSLVSVIKEKEGGLHRGLVIFLLVLHPLVHLLFKLAPKQWSRKEWDPGCPPKGLPHPAVLALRGTSEPDQNIQTPISWSGSGLPTSLFGTCSRGQWSPDRSTAQVWQLISPNEQRQRSWKQG